MHNINTTNSTKNVDRTNRWKTIGSALMLTTLLSVNSPAEAKINGAIADNNNQLIEVFDTPNIIASIEKRTWVKIPNEYRAKINDLVATNKVMKSPNWVKFTEDFIVSQMKQNWWITKENQLLFIWSVVYEKLTNQDLYDWSDGDDFRLEEFGNAIDNIEKCWNDYVEWINSYMEKVSLESRQHIIEVTEKWINELIRFYNLYRRDPSSIKPEELNQAMEYSKVITEDCKEYWIDYKQKFPEEVRRFYWIE